MDTRKKLFERVFEEVLDYSDTGFKHRAAQWGQQTYERIEREGKVVVSPRDVYPTDFTYALTFAVIVGEFGRFAFNDHFLIHMALPEREIALGEEYILLPDLLPVVVERKEDIYVALKAIYNKDPAGGVYYSLLTLFEAEGRLIKKEEELRAYTYIDSGFMY